MYNWIKDNKKLSCLILIMSVLGLTYIINILYKIDALNYWFEAEWSPGEFLTYFGSILAFVATIILGYSTLVINERATNLSEKLVEMQKNSEKAIAVINVNEKLLFFTKNRDPILINRLAQNGVDFSVDYIEDTYSTRDIMIMEFYLINMTDNIITNINLKQFNIILDDEEDTVIKPLKCDDGCGVILGKLESIKVKVILTGLKDHLNADKFRYFDYYYGFDINCVFSFQNLYNQVNEINITIGTEKIADVKQLGKNIYKIFIRDFSEIKNN